MNEPSSIWLVGAGTVGRAILADHLQHGIDTVLFDTNQANLDTAKGQIESQFQIKGFESQDFPVSGLRAVAFSLSHQPMHRQLPESCPSIVIESVIENLEIKRSLFRCLRERLGTETILATNTSNLRIGDIFQPLAEDSRCCGMHFFMPVEDRPLVELIAGDRTSSEVIESVRQHALRFGKSSLVVRDSPGFIVNRMLAPYLNQSLVLLEQGVAPERLANAARAFGMPLPPTKLIDTIGVRTAFDSGRVFWQAFAHRIEPSPILPGMIRAERKNSSTNIRFHEADSDRLTEPAQAVIDTYRRPASQTFSASDQDLIHQIGVPMWLEAAELVRSGVVSQLNDIELAMSGGLGFRPAGAFFEFFDRIGCERLRSFVLAQGEPNRMVTANRSILDRLASAPTPSAAVLEMAPRLFAPVPTIS